MRFRLIAPCGLDNPLERASCRRVLCFRSMASAACVQMLDGLAEVAPGLAVALALQPMSAEQGGDSLGMNTRSAPPAMA
jgi:hypothetical protein